MGEQGQIFSAQDYYPYGELLRHYITGNDNNGKYKFTEKERDAETMYDYFGARYYDSELGRWGSVDPKFEKYAGWSTYNYTLDNPIILFDIDGRDIFSCKSWNNSNYMKLALEIAGRTQMGNQLYTALDIKNNDILIAMLVGAPSAGGVNYEFSDEGKGGYGPRFNRNYLLPNPKMRPMQISGEDNLNVDERRLFPIIFNEENLQKRGLVFTVCTIIHELQHVELMLKGVPIGLQHNRMGHVVDETGESRFYQATKGSWEYRLYHQVKEAVDKYYFDKRNDDRWHEYDPAAR